MGVENITLSMDFPDAPSFRAAGYAPIATDGPGNHHAGGLVRQHGRVSFSRVFEAGHAVAAYAPATVGRIFERAVLGRDVATGTVDASRALTEGSLGVFTDAVLPPVLDAPRCGWYVVNDTQTCTDEQRAAVLEGTAVVVDWEVVSPAGVFLPTSGNPAGAASTQAAVATAAWRV